VISPPASRSRVLGLGVDDAYLLWRAIGPAHIRPWGRLLSCGGG
jgi:hypothetical protein